MEILYTRSCFYRREYFIFLSNLVIIDMRLCFFAEFDDIMLLQSSIKTIMSFLASKGKFWKCSSFVLTF